MSKSIEGYLAELKKLLSKDLSAKEVENHLSEIRNHLDCAAAEMSGHDAESRAIEEFGDVKSVAAKLISAHVPKRRWAGVGALASSAAIPLTLLLGVDFLYKYGLYPVWGTIFVAFVSFIAFSVLAKKLLSKQIAVLGAATILAIPLIECLLFVTIFPRDGQGLVPRYNAEAFVVEQQRRLAQLAPTVSEVTMAENAYGQGSQSALNQLKTEGGYTIPARITYTWPAADRLDATLLSVTAPTVERAKTVWEKHQGLVSEVTSERDYALKGTRVASQLNLPVLSEYWAFLKDPKMLKIFGLYFLLMGLINYLCVTIPIWTRRVRRRIQLAG
jgi:hypothetical protein